MIQLSRDIEEAKGELYTALETTRSLINYEVYSLSLKLDRLIFEYQIKNFKRKMQ